jgi:hypothetical protein
MIRRPLAFFLCFVTSFAIIGALRTAVAPVSTVLCAAACSTPNPTLVNGKPVSWGNVTMVSVYTDLVGSESEDVKAAITQWNMVGAVPQMQLVSTADPGVGAPGYIRIVSNPSIDSFIQQPPMTSNVITSLTISYNKSAQIQDNTGAMVKAYTPVINNGDQFLTNAVAHELGHALGLSDWYDANGNEVDSSDPSVMGGFNGTNNQGFSQYTDPTTGLTYPAQPPGHLSAVTPCDQAAMQALQTAPKPLSPSGGGGGGKPSGQPSGPHLAAQDCTIVTYEEWDDSTNTLTSYSEEIC